MSSSFDVNDGRHFENPYENYSADEMKSCEKFITDKLKPFVIKLMLEIQSTEIIWGNHNNISVYTGTSGIAYAFYHSGIVLKDIKYILEAQRILDQYPEIPRGKKEISFITGTAGPLALKAVLYNTKFDFGIHETNDKKSKEMIMKLKSMHKYVLDENSNVPDELLYGRIGYLYALLFVNAHSKTQLIEDDFIKEVVNSIIKAGITYSSENQSKSPLMYAWHEKEYLGGAHGVAGILYILLQARQYLSEQQLNEYINPTLQFLLKLRYKSKNFPSSIGSVTDKLVHWCHGAPSMTMLFYLAYQVFGNDEYLQIAIDCGDVIWNRGLLKKGYSICHGVSGNAYSFLTLFQQTKNEKYLYQAYKFGEWIMTETKINEIPDPDRPFSLFEGKAGQLYFLVDLMYPNQAKFPGYSI